MKEKAKSIFQLTIHLIRPQISAYITVSPHIKLMPNKNPYRVTYIFSKEHTSTIDWQILHFIQILLYYAAKKSTSTISEAPIFNYRMVTVCILALYKPL